MSVSALAASRLASPSVSGVGAPRPAYYKSLSDAKAATLTVAQIGAMQPVEMSALKTSQIGIINPQTLASGLMTYQNNTGEALPANVISGLSGSQIGQFSTPLLQSVLPSLSNTQLGAITGPQIGALPSDSLAALKPAQLTALNPTALANSLESYVSNKQAIPAQIMANLGSTVISQFSVAAVNATMSKMSPAQIGTINPAVISGIGTAALQSLGGAQLIGFTETQMDHLSPSQVAALQPKQISAVAAAWLNKLSVEQMQSLGAASIAALTTAQIKGLHTDHVQYLSGAQVATLSKAQLGALSSNQIQAIDAPDISAMSTGQFSALSKMQLQALTTGQIGQINGAKVRTISAANLASLSYQQIAAFDNPTVAQFSATQLAGLTADQLANGFDAEKIAALSASLIKSLKPNQLAAFNAQAFADALEIYVSTNHTAPAPQIIASIGVDQISRFSSTLLQSVLPFLSTAQLGAITASQIGDMSAASLAALKPGQRGALNPEALAGGVEIYVSNKQVAPPASIIAALSSDQVSRFSASTINLVLPQLSSGQIGGIKASAVAEISLDGIQQLSNTQLTGFTENQLYKLGNAQFQWIADRKESVGFTSDQLDAIDGRQHPQHAGDATIDLGRYGKLINPVQVDGGKWYYYWDRSGDGTAANSGSLNGGTDLVNRSVTNNIFNKDINGNANPKAAAGSWDSYTTQTYRYAAIKGVHLALPTLVGENMTNWYEFRNRYLSGYPGIGVSAEGEGSNALNPSNHDYAAIWDAYGNSRGDGWPSQGGSLTTPGIPPGWSGEGYFTSTAISPGYEETFINIYLSNGAANCISLLPYGHVALQVLSVDEA